MSTLLLYFVLSLPLVGAYALLGLGITVIYQASRVLNLAHGAMAMMGAYATYAAVTRFHLPVAVAVAAGVAMGAALGLLVEYVFVRRLRSAGPTTQTVGTVAALSLAIAVISVVFGTLPLPDVPRVFPRGAIRLGPGFIPFDQFGIFPVAVVGTALMFAIFQFTRVGLAMRGAAQNRRGAALRGVDPDRTAALAWMIGGAFAGLAGILLAGAEGLNPFSIALGVLPAFVAALIGGLESMPGVLGGAILVGVVQGMVPALAALPFIGLLVQGQGAPQLALGVVALIVMALRGARLSTGDVRGDAL